MTQYRTGETDPIRHFYLPCLRAASRYDRAVGYFRSSIYYIVGAEVLEFARAGGKIRLVCSPSLEQEDARGIDQGYDERSRIERGLLAEIDLLLAAESTSYPTRVLATLVAVGALDIKLALKSSSSGIYHEKIGIFEDRNLNAVSFLGSANETWSGWHEKGNHEALEVFCSWRTDVDEERVRRHQSYFASLWAGQVSGLEVIGFPEVARDRLLEVSYGGFNEALDADPKMRGTKAKRALMAHQQLALERWKARGRKGIFEHATGSGKTFLAVTAIKDHIGENRPALVVVPSKLLLVQWAKEIRQELPYAVLLVCGGGNARWSSGDRLKSMTMPSDEAGPRVVLATMQTAATDKFRRCVAGGDHLMIVADEVHQAGSPFNSGVTKIESGPRIGLSATPERFGDPAGTETIFNYFGEVVPPKVSLNDAIEAGRLVPYQYYPRAIHLSAEEADRWRDLTRRIGQEMSRSDESRPSERARMLMIQRSRVAKKALSKVRLAAEILSSSFSVGERWLVYCEDIDQLEQVVDALRSEGLKPVQYYSAMEGDPAATLAWFESAGGVLVSIKCLDEGVDIPAADHALILASSQNPRQFIQRRGRVLRRSPGKNLAVIHDAIVVPPCIETEPEQTSLARSELLRAIEFAKSAINRNAAGELRRMMIEIGLDPDSSVAAGIEEEEQ